MQKKRKKSLCFKKKKCGCAAVHPYLKDKGHSFREEKRTFQIQKRFDSGMNNKIKPFSFLLFLIEQILHGGTAYFRPRFC